MWYQLQIEQCQPDEAQAISEALEETAALAVTLTDQNDDPILEPEPGTTPLWPKVIINALYSDEQEAQLSKSIVASQYQHLVSSIQKLADQDWERVCMADFKPQRFGQRLWICPSWFDPPEPEAVNLILDPGLAFGTGTHPTTSLCLHWLDQADLANKTVMDYGCGSGILALAALKLGASYVQAVDIDEQALQATASNASINAIDLSQIHIGLPNQLQAPVDVLIANILLAPLLVLRDQFKQSLNNNGTLVISGILAEQASSLITAYQPDFILHSSTNKEGWSLLAFTPVSQ